VLLEAALATLSGVSSIQVCRSLWVDWSCMAKAVVSALPGGGMLAWREYKPELPTA